ncbi:hypothetical protein SAMN05660443_1965, partial [Marinospirillum celere]
LSIAGDTTFNGAVSQLDALVIDGSLDLQASLDAASLSVSNTANLAGDVTTTGTQTYSGAATLEGNRTLEASSLTFAASVTGDDNDLSIAGDSTFNGTVSQLNDLVIDGTLDLQASLDATSLSVSNTANLAGDVTTTGTQTYSGSVTLEGNRTLEASSLTFAASVTGDDNDLSIDGNTTFNGTVSQLDDLDITGTLDLQASLDAASLSVSNTANLAGDVTTTGTQTYSGAVTLEGNRTLEASSLTFEDTLTGDGNDLSINGNTTFNGAVSQLDALVIDGTLSLQDSLAATSLSVSNTANLAGDVTTAGTQTYSGAVTLEGNRTLEASSLTFAASVTGDDNDLSIAGDTTFNGTVSQLDDLVIDGSLDLQVSLDAASLSVSNTANLAGDVTTTGTQTYAGMVNLNGNRTLQASSLDFQSTLNGNNNSLTLSTGSGSITASDVWSDLNNLTITEAQDVSLKSTQLNGNFQVDSASGTLSVDGDLLAQRIWVQADAAELTDNSSVTALGADTQDAEAIVARVNALTLGDNGQLIADNGSFRLAPVDKTANFSIAQASAGNFASAQALHYDLNAISISTDHLYIGQADHEGAIYAGQLDLNSHLTLETTGELFLRDTISTQGNNQNYLSTVTLESDLVLNAGSTGDLLFSQALSGPYNLTLARARNIDLQQANINGDFAIESATGITQLSGDVSATSIILNSRELIFKEGITLDTANSNGDISLVTDQFTVEGALTVDAGAGTALLAAQDRNKDLYVCLTNCSAEAEDVLYRLTEDIQVTAGNIQIGSRASGERHQGDIYLQRLPFEFDLQVTTDAAIQLEMLPNANELNLNGLLLEAQSILLLGLGESTLTGYELSSNQWTLTGDNEGLISNSDNIRLLDANGDVLSDGAANYSGFTHFIGGNEDDHFQLEGNGRITGSINGQGGSNTLDISQANTRIELELDTNFSNIQTLIGDGDILLGSQQHANHWALTGASSGELVSENYTLEFTGFNLLTSGSGVENTFTSNGSYQGDLELSGNNRWNYTATETLAQGQVRGDGSLTIDTPASGTNLTLGASDLVLPDLSEHTGVLVIGGLLEPENNQSLLPLVGTTRTTVNTNRLRINEPVNVGSDLIFLGSDIELNSNITTQRSVTFISVGDSSTTANNLTGQGDLLVNGQRTVTASNGRIIAANGITNSDSLLLNFNGGDFELAVSAERQDASQPSQASSAVGVDLSDNTRRYIEQSLGLELVSVSVSFVNPAAAILGVRAIEVIDIALFEEDLTLFGRLGEGVALAFAQCEEVEGCTPDVTQEELTASIDELDTRIQQLEAELETTSNPERHQQLEELLAGYRTQKDEFAAYLSDLQDFTGFEDQLADELGDDQEIDMEAIEREVAIIETIYTRVQFLESLQFNRERREMFAERTGLDLTEERLEQIIESTMKAAARTEALIERMLDGD